MVIANLGHLELNEGFHFHCFPQDWVDRYVAKDYFKIDPIIAASMTMREPFHWFDVGSLVKLTPEQQDYLADLRAHGMVDGLAVPVFSSVGTAAYFGVGPRQRAMTTTAAEQRQIMYACNQVHNRFMDLRGAPPTPSAALSKREKDVLTQVVRGASNAEIAEALAISEHTVDTLLRRSFAKLGVSDRVSAALKAVGMGAVHS